MSTIEYQNAPRRFRMQDFKSVSDQYGGFAKSSKYAVVIHLQGQKIRNYASQDIMRDLTYLCEVAELPGRGFMAVDGIRYYGPTFKLPIMSAYEDINLTFLCRNKQYERQVFDNWMEIINPTDTYDFRYRDDYKAEIDVWQFNDVGEDYADAEYCITLQDAFPVLVNPQSATRGDDNYQRLTVSFTYMKWVRRGIDRPAGDYRLVEGKTTRVER